jgi:pimeloyl-ACP methyl ester carboxylesterase
MLDLFQGGPKDRKFLDGLGPTPTTVPGYSQADLDYSLGLFRQSGFRGPLNWYRNLPRQRELTPWLEDARILAPAMFAYGDDDTTTRRTKDFDRSLANAPVHEQDQYFENLMGKAIVPGSGHWPMIENPHFVNSLLLNFLYSVSPWPKK